MPDQLNALAAFVLDTVDQLRTLTGEQAAESVLSGVQLRAITFSIPYDPGSRRLLAAALPPFQAVTLREPGLRLPQALEVLRALPPTLVFERAQLLDVPEQDLARLEITIRL